MANNNDSPNWDSSPSTQSSPTLHVRFFEKIVPLHAGCSAWILGDTISLYTDAIVGAFDVIDFKWFVIFASACCTWRWLNQSYMPIGQKQSEIEITYIILYNWGAKGWILHVSIDAVLKPFHFLFVLRLSLSRVGGWGASSKDKIWRIPSRPLRCRVF